MSPSSIFLDREKGDYRNWNELLKGFVDGFYLKTCLD